MAKNKKAKSEVGLPRMEAGLQQCMRAIDNQIARELQRSPAEREDHGVQKWEPFAERTERLVTFILDQLGEDTIALDSLLVLSQATAKALTLVSEDLGEDGLGVVRSQYCLTASDAIALDMQRIRRQLAGSGKESLN